MKVIDLLNKIANNEELPKKIKWNNKIYISKRNAIENFVDYISDDDDYCFEHYIGYSSLNEEVEILEENKKIEKLDFTINRNDVREDVYRYIMENRFKINEIIDYLKSEGE